MTNLNNIVKRRKTSKYMQLNNFPVQEDLEDLQSIGLLTYIMSLPEDWVLHKTQLQSKFTRRTVDTAWKILAQKNYVIGFHCYLEGKKGKQYFYNVSDIPFTQEDFNQFMEEVILSLTIDGKIVAGIGEMKDTNLVVPTEIFNVLNVQYKMNSIKRTDTKEIRTKEILTNKHLLTIDNYQETKIKSSEEIFKDACNEFYTTFAIGRWTKKQWNTLVQSFVDEIIESGRDKNIPPNKVNGYVYKALNNMAAHHDYKHSEEYEAYKEAMLNGEESATQVTPSKHFYNWLEERE